MINKKMTTVFSMRLAGYLMQRGFVLVSMEESDKNNGRNVFFFNNSDDLHKAIKEYRNIKN